MNRGAESEWFTSEVAVHLDVIYRYFVRRTLRSDADDLTAEVFAIAWRRSEDVPREAVLPWLYRTAGYVLANHRRRPVSVSLAVIMEPVEEDHARRVAERDELSRALAALTERDREILLLHAWEGLTGNEIADVLGITRSGAQAALSRARARLREGWDGRGSMQEADVS